MFGKVRCDTRHVEVVGGVRIQSLTSCCGFKTAKNTRVAVLKQQKNTVSNKLLRFKISKRTQSTKKEYQTLFLRKSNISTGKGRRTKRRKIRSIGGADG